MVKEPLGFVKVLQWVSVVWATGREKEVVGSGRVGVGSKEWMDGCGWKRLEELVRSWGLGSVNRGAVM